jgi:hypothetical protein
MKGIVFTEFLELVESQFGLEIVQKIIDECDLDTGGVYSSVGTYSHKDMFKMVAKLSEIKDIPVSKLLNIFGEYFFITLSRDYPKFMEQDDLFLFLESIERYIHPEVLKLYPEAELPAFGSDIKSKNEMILDYSSSRKLADLAIGLIKGAAKHYNEEVEIEKLAETDEGGKVRLKISLI